MLKPISVVILFALLTVPASAMNKALAKKAPIVTLQATANGSKRSYSKLASNAVKNTQDDVEKALNELRKNSPGRVSQYLADQLFTVGMACAFPGVCISLLVFPEFSIVPFSVGIGLMGAGAFIENSVTLKNDQLKFESNLSILRSLHQKAKKQNSLSKIVQSRD